MAHDLDETTGRPAMAYVGATPWHGLGEELKQGQPVEVWLKAARLEWKLQRLPVQYLVDGQLRSMDDRYVLVRSDTGDALSVVSDDYRIVQPAEVIEFYRDLVESQGYALETAGALNGGRKVWALARTGRMAAIDEAGKDRIAAYVLLATSCDKTLATTAAFTSVRVVCQNTLAFAMKDVAGNRRRSVKVTHSLRFDPAQVQRDLGLIDDAWASFLKQARKMSETSFSADDASSFFRDLLTRKEGEALTSKAEREHKTVMALFRSAPGQDLKTAKGSLWGAVNAATYYADHVRTAAPGGRLDSAWFGSGAMLKDRAWDLATEWLDASPA